MKTLSKLVGMLLLASFFIFPGCTTAAKRANLEREQQQYERPVKPPPRL